MKYGKKRYMALNAIFIRKSPKIDFETEAMREAFIESRIYASTKCAIGQRLKPGIQPVLSRIL